jgi:hypothetical protein
VRVVQGEAVVPVTVVSCARGRLAALNLLTERNFRVRVVQGAMRLES